jgi:hypothetical protein
MSQKVVLVGSVYGECWREYMVSRFISGTLAAPCRQTTEEAGCVGQNVICLTSTSPARKELRDFSLILNFP